MGSACGVSWDGTSGGKLDKSAIPDPPDHKSHYLNAAETKGDSSFPVVDGDGNLRAGNVNSAWKLKGRGEGVSEECLRKLDNAFDQDVLPSSAYDNKVTLDGDDEDFGINLEFSAPPEEALEEGFNKYGVRVRDDGSIDARFETMEPGVRRGVDITSEFLERVSAHDYGRIPLQLDHSMSQRANVGEIKDIRYSNVRQTQLVEVHVPNTGSSIRDDIIADFKHEPPQVQDISVSFNPRTVEVEVPDNPEGEPKFIDARIDEFSLTPFPAGYDNGGLTPAFSSAVEKACIDPTDYSEPDSQLIKRPHYLIRK